MIPITKNTCISFDEMGELIDPEYTRWYYDKISLCLIDIRGNELYYILQRNPDAQPQNQGSFVNEIFLDPDAGSYNRNLFDDFSTIPHFDESGGQVSVILFSVDEHGWATLDNLKIINSTPPPTITPIPSPTPQQYLSDVFTGTLTMKNPSGSRTISESDVQVQFYPNGTLTFKILEPWIYADWNGNYTFPGVLMQGTYDYNPQQRNVSMTVVWEGFLQSTNNSNALCEGIGFDEDFSYNTYNYILSGSCTPVMIINSEVTGQRAYLQLKNTNAPTPTNTPYQTPTPTQTFTPTPTYTLTHTPTIFYLPSDLNQDQSVNKLDLFFFTQGWLTNEAKFDIAPQNNNDGKVNALDLLLLIEKIRDVSDKSVIVTTPTPEPTIQSWKILPDTITSHSFFQIETINSKIYLIGDNQIVECFNTEKHKFESIAPMSTDRWALDTISIEKRIIAIGGLVDYDTTTSTCEMYDSVSDTWKPIANMHETRRHHQAVLLQGEIYVMGGWNNLNYSTNTVEVYNMNNDNWKRLPPMNYKRAQFQATVINNQIYVFGGAYNDSVERFNPQTQKWELLSHMNSVRYSFVHKVIDNKIYVLGGYDRYDHVLNTCEIYDTDTNCWQSMPPMQKGRAFFQAVVMNNNIIVLGGRDGNRNQSGYSECEKYNLETQEWEVFPSMQKQRYAHQSTILDDKIYVFGGEYDNKSAEYYSF